MTLKEIKITEAIVIRIIRKQNRDEIVAQIGKKKVFFSSGLEAIQFGSAILKLGAELITMGTTQ